MTRRGYTLTALSFMVFVAMVSGILAQQPAPAGPPAGGARGGGAAGGGRGGGRGGAPITLVFKETWQNTSTMLPMSQASVVNPDLELKMYGAGKTDFSVTNEGNMPHIWTGECESSCALTLRHKENFVDLTGNARIRWNMKTSGFHEIRPILKLADGTYLIGDHIDAEPVDYRESEFYISQVRWLKADVTSKVLTKGTLLATVDLSKVDEIGFADLTPGSGHGSGGYSDMAWIEVYGKIVKRDPAK
jgi:hypothetical protein